MPTAEITCKMQSFQFYMISLHALRRWLYDLLADYVLREVNLTGTRKEGHIASFFHLAQRFPFLIPLYRSNHLQFIFPHVTKTLHVNKLPEEASHPWKAATCAWHLVNTKPQFYKQAALERLVHETEVPRTLSNRTCLTTSLSFSSQLHTAFLLPHVLKEQPSSLSLKEVKFFYNQGLY